MMLMTKFRLLVAAAILMVPALASACATPQIAEGEHLSREGAKTLVHRLMSNSVLASYSDRGAVIQAQIEAAVVAEPPDWRLIERLQNEKFRWNIDLVRLAHEGLMKGLRELSRRDRAIYLLAMMSERSPIAPRDENSRRAEAIRRDIIASARCLIPDDAKLNKLLVESLQLHIRQMELGRAMLARLHADESPSDKIARLREEYRKGGPPPVMIVRTPSGPDDAETPSNDPN